MNTLNNKGNNIIEIIVREPCTWKRGEEISVALAPFYINSPFPIIKASQEVISTGLYIGDKSNNPLLQINRIKWDKVGERTQKLCTLKVLQDTHINSKQKFSLWKKGISLGIVTISDKGFIGQRKDKSGPLIEKILSSNMELSITVRTIIPDDFYTIIGIISHLALDEKIDLIITTGGTGVTSNDITPDATQRLIEKRLWGFEHAIFMEAIKNTKNAIISRAICGILSKSLIINLPGSEKAVYENLTSILPALDHTLKKIQDDPSDCGQ